MKTRCQSTQCKKL